MKIVELAINDPSKVTENKEIPIILQNSHKEILNQLPSLLEIISLHLKYLPQCCEILWELGKNDKRNTNPYPSHAIRVLKNIAKYDRGKDLKYNSAFLDVVENLLRDPNIHEYHYSPLDILYPLLAKEGTSEEFLKHQINFYPFSVSYENTKFIREKVLTILSECSKLKSTRTKLRVFRSLWSVLWPPHGQHNRKVSEEELTRWIPEKY